MRKNLLLFFIIAATILTFAACDGKEEENTIPTDLPGNEQTEKSGEPIRFAYDNFFLLVNDCFSLECFNNENILITDIIYSAADSTVCSISGNILTSLKAGNCQITADYYGEKATFLLEVNSRESVSMATMTVPYAPEAVLESLMLPKNLSWKNAEESLVFGLKNYDAVYNPDSQNYEDIIIQVPVEVVKAQSTLPYNHQTKTLDYYEGLSFKDITLDEGFIWKNPNALITSTTNNIEINYLQDERYYYSVETAVTIIVNKINASIINQPIVSIDENAVEGQPLPSLINGAVNVAGKFVWKEKYMSGGDKDYNWTFVADNTFYNNITGIISLSSLSATEGLRYNGSVVSYGDAADITGTLVIPYRYNNNIITSVASESFENCSATLICMPSVSYLGYRAFHSSNEVEEIFMPNIKVIDDLVFVGCKKLLKLDMPKLEKLGYGAFCFAVNLAEINAPELKEMPNNGYQVFEDSVWIKTGEFAKINQFLFAYNGDKGDVIIPEEITVVLSKAFENNSVITSVSMPNVKEIGFCGFYFCYNLVSVDMPAVEIIKQSVFNGDENLVSVNMPKIKTLDNFIFWGCNKITELDIGNAESVADSSFWKMGGLKKITVSEENDYFECDEGILYSKGKENLVMIPYDIEIETYSFPNETNSIECLLSFKNIKELNLNCFDGFHDEIFRDCPSLVNVLCSENNESYSSEGGVLYNKDKTSLIAYPCGRLDENYTALPSCTLIHDYGVQYTRYLKHFTGENIVEIGRTAFYEGISLESVNFPKLKTAYEECFGSCKKLTTVNAPMLESFGLFPYASNAFAGCDALVSINLSKITNLVFGTFQGCDKLESVVLNDNLNAIGGYCFSSCQSLIEFVIPEGVQSIGENAFNACYALISVEIRNTEYVIEGSETMFYNNGNLSIYVPDALLEGYKEAEFWKDYSDIIKPLSEKPI